MKLTFGNVYIRVVKIFVKKFLKAVHTHFKKVRSLRVRGSTMNSKRLRYYLMMVQVAYVYLLQKVHGCLYIRTFSHI